MLTRNHSDRTQILDGKQHAHLFIGVTHKQSHPVEVVHLHFGVDLFEDLVQSMDFNSVVFSVKNAELSAIKNFESAFLVGDNANNR